VDYPVADPMHWHKLVVARHFSLKAKLEAARGGPLPVTVKAKATDEPEVADTDDYVTPSPMALLLKDVRKTRVLSRDEERTTSKDRLIEALTKLVIAYAKKIARGTVPFEDVVAAGCVGLCEAAATFDPGKGFRFSTYAVKPIRWAMWHAVKCDGKSVNDVSLSTPVSESSNETLQDHLVYDHDVDDLDEDRAALAMAVRCLKPQERQIIRARYSGDDLPRFADVGNELGISGERVRQIENAAIEKLRGCCHERASQDPFL
jgi:RNA polymerase sigma factor (sigma-70 family)